MSELAIAVLDEAKRLQVEVARLRSFIKGLEKQTDCQMQNFMVQAVYDRINQECKEALEEKG